MSPSLGFPTEYWSKCICNIKRNVLSATITVYWDGGNIRVFLSNQGTILAPSEVEQDWEEITSLVSGVSQNHIFVTVGTSLYIRIIKDDRANISTQQDVNKLWAAPALQVDTIVFA